jgi:hypothetical protein
VPDGREEEESGETGTVVSPEPGTVSGEWQPRQERGIAEGE